MSKISDEYNKLLDKRRKMEGDIDYDNNPVIQEIITLMTADVSKTICFLENECTGEQFIWLSEVFDEIIAKTKSSELIKSLRMVAQKYPEAVREYNIDFLIDSAADDLENSLER